MILKMSTPDFEIQALVLAFVLGFCRFYASLYIPSIRKSFIRLLRKELLTYCVIFVDIALHWAKSHKK